MLATRKPPISTVFRRIGCVYRPSLHLNKGENFRNFRRFCSATKSKPNEPVVEAAGSSQFSGRNITALTVAGAGVAAILYYYQQSNENALNARGSQSIESRVKSLEKQVSKLVACQKNQAFVFIKPHAVTPEVEKLVLDTFDAKGIKVTKSGDIASETIDNELLIDTHYGAIANKAVKLTPNELILSDKAKKDFEKMSGMSWNDALAQNLVKNAKTYCDENSIDGQKLDEMWSKLKRGDNLIKFGGGFYCGKLANPTSGKQEYVINGFYMAMRSKFTQPGKCIKYFLVEFYPTELSWEEFRNSVLGVTDPATAAKGSLRRLILERWKALGLKSKPNTGDNGVHASASPFEAFAERCNWLKDDFKVEDDVFGKALLANDVKKDMLEEFMGDCSVNYEGKKQSIFDLLEDLDSEDCLEKTLEIAKTQ